MEISPQIVFDSQENERDSNDFYLKDSLTLNQVNDQLATTRQIPKSFIFAVNSENAFRTSNKKRSHFIQVSNFTVLYSKNCL